MEPNTELKDFLSPYSPEIQELTFELRNFVSDKISEANELIYDSYNAVSIAYSKSKKLKDAFCHIAVYATHVNFGFNRGAELTNKLVELEGKGKLIRHFRVNDMKMFPKEAIEKMLYEAIEMTESRNPELIKNITPGVSIVMSVSEKKRRPD
jgi:hypothetical protein